MSSVENGSGWLAPEPIALRGDQAKASFVIHLVAMATGISPAAIARDVRDFSAVRARQIAMYLAHTGLGWPLARVALAFRRDRTTVGLACRKVEDRRDEPAFDGRIAELERCLRAAPPFETERLL